MTVSNLMWELRNKNTLDFAEEKRVPCVIIDSSGEV